MKPHLEPLEPRLAPVVGATSSPAVPRGSGYDGVVRLEGEEGAIATGSLLFTGRHILTAAHVLRDGQGESPAITNVVFELVDGGVKRDIVLQIPAESYRLHPGYNGDPTAGNDIAVLVLPDQVTPGSGRQMVAPYGADRYDLYTGSAELGRVFTVAGYGRVGTGEAGSQAGTAGQKHLGQNRFDSLASWLSAAPFSQAAPAGDSALAWDFDDGAAANDAFGSLYGVKDLGLGSDEANPAQGDSGGPLFLRGRIAGVVSYSDGGSPADVSADIDRSFGEFGVATRVSSFQGFLAGATSGAYDLALDMAYQLAGVDGRSESLTITARRNGDNLELVVSDADNSALNGVYYSAPLSEVRSLTVRGSDDNETFRVVGDLGVAVTFVGRGGDDVVVLDPAGANTLRRGLSFEGGDGRDTFGVIRNANFVLSPGRVTLAGLGFATLEGVEVAQLRGGASGTRFHLAGWRGEAYLDGAAGRDQLVVSPTGVATLQRINPTRGVVRLGYADGTLATVTYARVEAVRLSVGATPEVRYLASTLTAGLALESDEGFVRALFRVTHDRAASEEEVVTWTRMVRHVGRESTARLALTWQTPSRALVWRELSGRLLGGLAVTVDVLQALESRGLLDDRLQAILGG